MHDLQTNNILIDQGEKSLYQTIIDDKKPEKSFYNQKTQLALSSNSHNGAFIGMHGNFSQILNSSSNNIINKKQVRNENHKNFVNKNE